MQYVADQLSSGYDHKMESTLLTRGCKAGLILLAKFRSGELTGTEKPKAVHESDPEFKKYGLTKFRSFYNRLKKEIVPPEGLEPTLNRKCTTPIAGKKRRLPLIADEADEDDDAISVDGGEEIVRDPGDFMPLTLISEWLEPKTMTKRVTVCVTLPSGVSSRGFSVRVLEGGDSLEITLSWREPLMDVEVLHRKWTALPPTDPCYMSGYHPEILGFEQALKCLRDRSTDVVRSTTRIPLPFPVETHIVDQTALAWRNDTMRAIYVRLRPVSEDYSVENNALDFEIV